MKKRMLALLTVLCMVGSLTSAVDDEIMRADAAEKTLNIVTTFGTSEVGQYGVPNAFIGRYDAITAKVADIYADRFGITINFTQPAAYQVVSSPADQCKTGASTFDAPCYHASYSVCSDSGPYHHTNASYIKSVLFPTPNTEVYGLEMYITAVELCGVDDGSHHEVYGVAFRNGGQTIIRDYDYTYSDYNVTNWLGDNAHIAYVAKTMAHEIGHLYYVEDHYDETYGNSKDYCIWGSKKNLFNIANQLYMCDDCKATIQANSRRYNF